MKVPANLIWCLTKNNSSFIVKRKNQNFSRDPNSISNLHNQSDSGNSHDNAVNVGLHKTPSKKAAKRVFELRQRH